MNKIWPRILTSAYHLGSKSVAYIINFDFCIVPIPMHHVDIQMQNLVYGQLPYLQHT